MHTVMVFMLLWPGSGSSATTVVMPQPYTLEECEEYTRSGSHRETGLFARQPTGRCVPVSKVLE